MIYKGVRGGSRVTAICLAAGAVLLFQWLISALLLDRTGNVPVGFDDSYSYLYGIKKIVLYGSGWPDVLHINKGTHFNYLSYNLIFGWLSRLSDIEPGLVFLSSFFWGKVSYVGSLIYWLKRRGLKGGLLSLTLLGTGLFIGDGSIHGSFWVVPSFWMLIGFLLLDGYAAGKDKLGWPTLLIGVIVYYNLHPLAIVLLPYFVLSQAMSWLETRQISSRVVSLVAMLVAALLLTRLVRYWVGDYTGRTISSPGVSGPVPDTVRNLPTMEQPELLLASEIRVNLIPVTITNLNVSLFAPLNETILKASDKIAGMLNSTSDLLPGIPGLWRGYVGKVLVFYPLLWMMPLWLRLIWYSAHRRWVYSYASIILVTVGLAWHSQAYRALIFVWPITLAVMMIGVHLSLKDKLWGSTLLRRFIVWSGAGVFFVFVLFQVYSGIGFVKYIGSQNQYWWNADICPKLLLARTEAADFDIFYNSFSGISAFVYHGLDQRHVGRTDKLLQVYPEWLKRYQKLYIVTENGAFDGGSDSVFTDDVVNKLEREYPQGKISLLQPCGFFSILEISDQE